MFLSQGWSNIKSEDDKAYIKKQKALKISAKLSGRQLGYSSTKGTTVWNDGERNYKLKECEIPNPNWIKGSVKRTNHCSK
jgi:hypothetical protein